MAEISNARLLKERDVLERAGGVSRSWFRKEVAEGRAPRPVKPSRNMALWVADEVDDWIVRLVSLYRAAQMGPSAAPVTTAPASQVKRPRGRPRKILPPASQLS